MLQICGKTFLEKRQRIPKSTSTWNYFQRMPLMSRLKCIHNYPLKYVKFVCFSEQKVAQYEQYVRDLQAHHRAVANCQEMPNGISYQDLQQEVLNISICS